MNLMLLRDRLDDPSRQTLKPRFDRADNLSKRIFNPELGLDEVSEYYIPTQRQPEAGPEESEEDAAGWRSGFGAFEDDEVGKLLCPKRKVLCIHGPMGCGKTTTVQYIVEKLRLRPHDCENDTDLCHKDRMILYIDFRHTPSLSDNNEERVTTSLLEILCNQMRAQLKTRNIPEPVEEVTSFWAEELECLRAKSSTSSAFAFIAGKLTDASPDHVGASPITEKEFAERKDLLGSVEARLEYYLDYLVRLWGYVIRTYYHGNHGCAFVVLDNIDKASAIAQSRLVYYLKACARDPGPTFLITVRPETFRARGIALAIGADVLDIEEHKGPPPSQVVLDRLQRFVRCPDPYFLKDGLAYDDFQEICSYLHQVRDTLASSSDSAEAYLGYLDAACGRDLRLALVMSQKLITNVGEFELRESPSGYTLIRVCVRPRLEAHGFQAKPSSQSLFHVIGEEYGRLLVKPRILQFLFTLPEKAISLNGLIYVLAGFGYREKGLIRKAINELLHTHSQLVRSNGFDSYTEEEFLNCGTQQIVLTEMGHGHIKTLLRCLEYVQEAMLDAYVPVSHLDLRVSYSYLPDKLLLLDDFLRTLERADREETDTFIRNLGRREYFRCFGKHLLSLEMIWEISKSINGLTRALEKTELPPPPEHTGPWIHYSEIRERFTSLLKIAEHDNNNVLGIWPRED